MRQNTDAIQSNYLIMERVLKDSNPILYQACIYATKALLEDLSHIPYIYNELTKIYEPTPDNRAIILAVIYKLYAPHKLHFADLRSKNGIRSSVAKLMNLNHPTHLNEHATKLISYYKGDRWAKTVNSLADEILNKLNPNDPTLSTVDASLTEIHDLRPESAPIRKFVKSMFNKCKMFIHRSY